MERHEVLDLMKTLRLSGMRAAFDEIVDQAIKRQHPIQRVIGELLKAEIADKKARSIKYSDDHRQAAHGQGVGRLRLFRQSGQRTPGPGSGHRRFPGRQAQPRPGRRNGQRQNPSECRHRPRLHPQQRAGTPATTSSIWSITSMPRRGPATRGAPPINCAGAIWSSSMN